MKILMLCWEFPPKFSGGLGIACKGLAESLIDKGHEVSVLLPRIFPGHREARIKLLDASAVTPKDYLHVYESQDVPDVIEQLELGKSIVPYLPPKFFKKRSKQPTTEAPVPKEVKDLISELEISGEYSPSIFLELKVYALVSLFTILKEDFDVIHAHDWMTFPAATLAKNQSRAKVLYHVHSTEIDRNAGWSNPEVIEIEKENLAEADQIAVVSKQQKNRLVEDYGISDKKIFVLPNGLTNQIKISKKKKSLKVGFIGRFAEQKGPGRFVDIARQIKNRDSEISFSMVGEGHLLDDTKEKAHRLNVGIDFKGFLKHDQALKWMSELSLLIIPSGSEPFGLVALEAASMGIPVIISKGSGIVDFIPEFICPDPWNVHDFVHQSMKVLSDLEFSKKYAESCMISAKKLTWSKSVTQLLKVYGKINA